MKTNISVSRTGYEDSSPFHGKQENGIIDNILGNIKQHAPEILDITHGFSSGSSTPEINAQREHYFHCLSGDQICCPLEI